MATRVYFTGSAGDSPLSIRVAESVDEVSEAWTGAAAKPFPLTQTHDGRAVRVNPAAVAYWIESPEKGQRSRPWAGSSAG